MKKTWPDKTGCLCARMSRGFNGQDAIGLTVVIITSPDRQSANLFGGGGINADGKTV